VQDKGVVLENMMQFSSSHRAVNMRGWHQRKKDL